MDPSVVGPWAERITVVSALLAVIYAGHKRIWVWGYQLREAKAQLEIERARAEEFKDHLFRVAGIVSEALPRLVRRVLPEDAEDRKE